VTPVFNAQDWLEQSIISVAVQTGVEFEHIIVDDGSTDGSWPIALALSQRFSHIRLVRQENDGEAAAVNSGLMFARGKFALVLCADDLLEPYCLATLARALEAEPGLTAVYPDWNTIDSHGQLVHLVRTHEYSQQELIQDLACIPGPGTMFRRLDRNGDVRMRDVRIRWVSDWEFWVRLSFDGPMKRVNQTLASWRLHDSNASIAARGGRAAEEIVRVVDELFSGERVLPHPTSSWKTATLSRALFVLACAQTGSGLTLTAILTYVRLVVKFTMRPPCTIQRVREGLQLLAFPLKPSVFHRAMGRRGSRGLRRSLEGAHRG
jgi:glycosyltransferase involved in cell wall biosynthesis